MKPASTAAIIQTLTSRQSLITLQLLRAVIVNKTNHTVREQFAHIECSVSQTKSSMLIIKFMSLC